MSEPLAIQLPDALVEAVAERAAALVLERLREERAEGRWVSAKGAAEFLGWPVKRVYARRHLLPHRRDGQRLHFNTSELDAWLRNR